MPSYWFASSIRATLLTAAALAFCPSPVCAQANASIQGEILDQHGALAHAVKINYGKRSSRMGQAFITGGRRISDRSTPEF